MKELFTKHKGLILFAVIAIVILYLTQDYYKKTETYKEFLNVKLEETIKEKARLEKTVASLSLSIDKLEQEVKKKDKKVRISIKTNVDGSSTKDIAIDESESQEKNSQDKIVLDSKIEQSITIKDLEYKLKEEQTRSYEYKIEEEKRSNKTLLWGLGIGGAAFLACSITKKCGIIKIPFGG